MVVRKKLIEVSLPLEVIDTEALRRKQKAPKGFPTGIHKYWAQRPIAACRAVIFAQYVDDPISWPDRFPGASAQQQERKRLHQLIGRLVPWEASNDERILNEARWEIARSVAWNLGKEPPPISDSSAIMDFLQREAPPVCDPFCGSGSISLEAQRLGLRTYGSDLNPIAVLISKSLVEIPARFRGLPPVNPDSRTRLSRAGSWSGRRAEGLADDIRYYGDWLRRCAEDKIVQNYPKIQVDADTEVPVVAWIWARTVPSPDPSARGAAVPLASTFLLSLRDGKKYWAEPVVDQSSRDGYRFEVRSGVLEGDDHSRIQRGTKAARGGFSCLLTGAAMSEAWIRSQAKAGRMGARLMAIVADHQSRRIYVSPSDHQEEIAARAQASWAPEEEMFDNALGFRVPGYGITQWSQVFTSRQLLTLSTLSDLIGDARGRVEADATEAGFRNDPRPLSENGAGARAYADAVATYLTLILDRIALYGSSLTSWLPGDSALANSIPRQALAMVWDFAEANPFGKSSGGMDTATKVVAACVECCPALPGASIEQRAAQNNSFPSPAGFSLDPPYFDNIGYADLWDFFYVWASRTLRNVWPDLFRRLLTPKVDELVATPHRHGGAAGAERYFMAGMSAALRGVAAASHPDMPLTIFYAFKQSEVAEEGLSSTGWSAFLQAVCDAGLLVDGTWPVRTEGAGRMRSLGSNALASSIILVCRKRPHGAAVATRAEFVRMLRRELPDSLADIRAAGIQAVDFQQAAIGPGMGVFSRFTKVMEADDSPMSVRTALALINGLIEELASEQDATYDSDSQAALVWFQSYGWTEQPSGQAITLATSKDTALDSLFRSGVFTDLRGKVRLTKRSDLPTNWRVATDRHLILWEAAQHLARALDAEDGGIDAAARLFRDLGARAADVLPLIYRLYQIAGEQRKDATEALVWNRLQAEWPAIERRAAELAETRAPTSPTLFDRGAAQ